MRALGWAIAIVAAGYATAKLWKSVPGLIQYAKLSSL